MQARHRLLLLLLGQLQHSLSGRINSCVLLLSNLSLQAIHDHVSSLQAWTYAQLSALRHSSGQQLLQIFGKHATPARQSCLFQFLVHAPNGSVVPAEEVELAAAAAGIHLRTGCHCNPGQCLLDLGIEPQEVSKGCFTSPDGYNILCGIPSAHWVPLQSRAVLIGPGH